MNILGWIYFFAGHPVHDVNVDRIVVSNSVPLVKRVFIGYKDVKKVRPLCIILPKMIAHRRDSDETKYMSFLIKKSLGQSQQGY